jgi:hypothetical protein
MSCERSQIENPEVMGESTPTLKISRSSEDDSRGNGQSAEEVSDESLIIDTRTLRTLPSLTASAQKCKSEPTTTPNGGNVPSFHIQKTLNVNGAFAKILFDFVKDGDISVVKK